MVLPFARPIPPVRLCLWQVGALQKRWDIGLWLLWGACRKLLLGYSGDPSPTPNWGLTTPSQNLHCSLWSNGARYNGGLYWQCTATYDRPTQQYHRLLSKALLTMRKEGSQKIPTIGCVVGFTYVVVLTSFPCQVTHIRRVTNCRHSGQ